MRSRGLQILFLVAVLLLVYFFTVERPRENARRDARDSQNMLAVIDPDSVARVTVERPSNTISFQMRGTHWIVTAPITDKADQASINRIFLAVSGARIFRDLGPSTDLARYGLLAPQAALDVEDAAGNPVSLATVTIKNPSLGEITLLETSAGSGKYTAVRNSFPSGDFELNVVLGTDNIQGVILGGPGIHTITAPLANDTLVALQSLIVTWNSPSQAKSAEVETRDYGPVVVPDTGAVMVPSLENVVRADQRIRVFRFNEVGINGGLPGSRMKVEVRQTVEPVIIQ
ncbi:MAG: hypothetical protein IH969_06525 [Candidatus Krumholzibacteriota bacterium]|nr:hypothetical protein [Candidatus Krumholzibacteriota bacterium]